MSVVVRLLPTLLVFTFVADGFAAEVERIEINHEYVTGIAQGLAQRPYRARDAGLPDFLRELTYDDYRRIRFIDEESLWRRDDLPFRVQFFHPGHLFHETVEINEFTAGFTQRIPFLRSAFDYQDLKISGRLPGSLGYAGFRVLGELNAEDRYDELISYLGASYYRALGSGHRYGLSARGLALNYGGPEVEEFPRFIEFWLGKPAGDASVLTIHALLDSPSVAGAYTFQIAPGEETLVDTTASLFFRQRVTTVGIAPLTSMYWFGENFEHRFGDFRPEVHDSDGLLTAPDADTRIWRPLDNPRQPRISTFPGAHGFGLLQRDRDYKSYVDAEARYELRPTVWVEPGANWPDGHVRLLEFGTTTEYTDNMVAAWVPAQSPAPGERLDVSYRQRWTSESSFGGPPGMVIATRRTVRVDNRPGRTSYVVDFALPETVTDAEGAPVTAEVIVPPTVHIAAQHIHRNDVDGTWRLSFTLDAPDGGPPVELRARLLRDGKSISETWVTTWEQ